MALPLIFNGAPDRDRSFDFEIIRRLPERVLVWIDAPLALVKRLKTGRSWDSEIDRKRGTARLRLPVAPGLRLRDVRLGKKDRHRARLLVQCAAEVELGGHSIAVRQLHHGEEVGRVTWLFRRRLRD